MAFKNEVVSDADIDRYNLPFQKGDGRWWTRDAERDYYLWGGLSGNPGYDTEQVGRFYLYTENNIHLIMVIAEESFSKTEQFCHQLKWKAIGRIVPDPINSAEKVYLLHILKEALHAYGYDGQDDGYPKDTTIEFDF